MRLEQLHDIGYFYGGLVEREGEKVFEGRFPFPPSKNALYRVARGHLYKTRQAKEYTAGIVALASRRGPLEPFAGPVGVRVLSVYPDHRRRDLMNSEQIVSDSLQAAGVIDNDCQIAECFYGAWPKQAPGWLRVTVASAAGVFWKSLRGSSLIAS